MQLKSKKMNPSIALDILKWRYEPPYELYSNEVTDESLKELLDNPYYAVFDEDVILIGFYCYGAAAQVPGVQSAGGYLDSAIDVGIGMAPAMTGKGNGRTFFSFVLKELNKSFPHMAIRLTVADFNKRAIKLYENLGFLKEKEFMNGATAFITMVKKC